MQGDVNLIAAASEWQGRIEELQALIAKLEAEVVEAEVGLTEELSAVNAFEFKLRAGIHKLVKRLDQLGGQIGELRKKLRHQYESRRNDPDDWSYEQVESAFYEEPLDHSDYRYHSTIPEPFDGRLDEDKATELKRLYRELARRFHPDMAVGEEDRLYRTQLMMAINAAYAAGDLERLKALALEPDLVDGNAVADDEQLVNYLLRELGRLQRRLGEIQEELDSIQAKQNYRLMQQADRAEEKGQDWLGRMKVQLQEEIAQRLVERDVIQQELKEQEMITAEESGGLQGEAFAEAILDISLDASFDVDPDVEAGDWFYKRNPRAGRPNLGEDEVE